MYAYYNRDMTRKYFSGTTYASTQDPFGTRPQSFEYYYVLTTWFLF